MGALYYLKQKLVDFANVVQSNVNRSDTVPSSKVVYDELATKVNTSDIVNDLTHTDTDKPLSANQGKILNDTFSDSTIPSGVITWNSAYVWDTYNTYNITRSGKVVHLSIRAYKLADDNGIPRDSYFATIASGYRPRELTYSSIGMAIYGSNSSAAVNYSVGGFYITTDGQIRHSLGGSKIFTAYVDFIYFLP